MVTLARKFERPLHMLTDHPLTDIFPMDVKFKCCGLGKKVNYMFCSDLSEEYITERDLKETR
jgi:hypothetical protein